MALNKTLNHKIWCLAWPMIISNISVPLLGLVDTAILGHLEKAQYLAAVAIGSSILAFLYWGFAFLRMGTTGLTAQAEGAKHHNQSRLILAQSMILGAGLGVIIVLFSPILLELGLSLVLPTGSNPTLAYNYAQIRILSAPALLINFAIIGWMIGCQNTRWPLLIALFTNGLNIALDFLFILGFGLQSDGAAVATAISEYSGCGLALWVVRKELSQSLGTLDTSRLINWLDYRQLLSVNRHLFIRTLALLASFAFFTSQGAHQGETVLAANTIIMNLLLLTAYGLDGIANAAEALVGEAIGKQDYQRFIKTCWHSSFWSLIVALLFCLIFILAGKPLIALMTSITEVKQEAEQFLPWLCVLPIIAVWSYLLDGIFIGATQSATMQNTMLASVILVYLPCWYLTQSWGNHGLWFAFLALNFARGLSLALAFYRRNQRAGWW